MTARRRWFRRPEPAARGPLAEAARRKVQLRSESNGSDSRLLWAYLDAAGNLHVDGQDLGPGTAPVSDDGEYEWFQQIAAADVPRLVEALGGGGLPILDLLEQRFTGRASYELERTLRESGIPVARHVT